MALKRSHRTVAEWPLLLLAVALVGSICIPLWQWSASGDERGPVTAERLGRMLLGPEQIAAYACFAWAGFILATRYLELRRQRQAFGLDLLPADESVRILPEDARTLQRRVEQLSERGGPYVLSNMIRLALSKFVISRSPQDASETVRSQTEVELARMASTMSTVHYLAWAIPALGFVGTVRGMGMALAIVPKVDADGIDTTPLAHSLAVAFDTTLVALLLSLVLMFLLHSQQRDEEGLVLDSQQFCLEHLVNRLADLSPAPTAAAAAPAAPVSGEYSTTQPWAVY